MRLPAPLLVAWRPFVVARRGPAGRLLRSLEERSWAPERAAVCACAAERKTESKSWVVRGGHAAAAAAVASLLPSAAGGGTCTRWKAFVNVR